ncbi:biotin--[acetyl-CoA-carboxylase] ligase [Chelatococcus sp. GCM10030263]|uniref:biotin--[acetyl-CoA-carboxylase] ligase n=1 Tax=Chelatococcus sp. GCM10030263 TaxID=3273387 RepID=UPI0036234640
MAFTLGAEARAAGFQLVQFDRLGSTNAEALVRGRSGERGPTWFVAREQSAARGRRGNAWASPAGNLAASLLKVVDVPPPLAATLGFVAGLALADALAEVAPYLGRGSSAEPSGRVALKWPNDVLVDGAKLAGILLESEQTDHGRALVIGIGVNVASAPEGLPYPAAALASLGVSVTAETLFTALSDSWVACEGLWDQGRGLSAVRRRWLDRAAGLGRPVAVRIGQQILRGTFETIDDSGQLVLRRADGGTAAIAAGDVHFGEAATARA